MHKSLALVEIGAAYCAVGKYLKIEVLGKKKKASILVESPYDPNNEGLRA